MSFSLVCGLKNKLQFFSRSAGPQTIPSQTYDYAALNAFASGPQASVGTDNSHVSTTVHQANVGSGDSSSEGNLSGEAEGEDEDVNEDQGDNGESDSENSTSQNVDP